MSAVDEARIRLPLEESRNKVQHEACVYLRALEIACKESWGRDASGVMNGYIQRARNEQ